MNLPDSFAVRVTWLDWMRGDDSLMSNPLALAVRREYPSAMCSVGRDRTILCDESAFHFTHDAGELFGKFKPGTVRFQRVECNCEWAKAEATQ